MIVVPCKRRRDGVVGPCAYMCRTSRQQTCVQSTPSRKERTHIACILSRAGGVPGNCRTLQEEARLCRGWSRLRVCRGWEERTYPACIPSKAGGVPGDRCKLREDVWLCGSCTCVCGVGVAASMRKQALLQRRTWQVIPVQTVVPAAPVTPRTHTSTITESIGLRGGACELGQLFTYIDVHIHTQKHRT